MVAGGSHAQPFSYFQAHFLVGPDHAFNNLNLFHRQSRHGFDRIRHSGATFRSSYHSGIAALAAGRPIKRSMARNNVPLVSDLQTVHRKNIFIQQGNQTTVSLQAVIPHEFRLHAFFQKGFETRRKVFFLQILSMPHGRGHAVPAFFRQTPPRLR